MTTEINNATEFDGTTMAEHVDIDRLIDLMSDAQLDRLTMRQRRRTNERIKAAAAVAALQDEQAAALNPTAEQRERRFRAFAENIPCVLNRQHNVVFHADGSERYAVGELAMPGAQSEVTHGGERGALHQLRSMHMYWQTLREEAEQRLAEVIQDTANYQQHETYYHAPPGALEGNKVEQRRLQGNMAAYDEVMAALLGLIGTIGDVERRTQAGPERNRLISEAISKVPAAAAWMSSPTALWRRN